MADANLHISVPVRRFGTSAEAQDAVAVEEPLEIRLGYFRDGKSHSDSISITMRTPGDDENLAGGFLLTEGIIGRAADIRGFEAVAENVIRVDLDAGVEFDADRLQRNFYTTSSCGVCGKASLEALKVQSRFNIDDSGLRVAPDMLMRLSESLIERQATFAATGGLHAAGLFDRDGRMLDVREDVGRHNAVDKVVGAALQVDAVPLLERGLIVSGRASFEILQKAMVAGCPLVVAIGAPSSLAIELAWEFDMTLVGFLRDGRFNIYTGPSRIE